MAQPFEGERDGRTPSIDTAHFHCGKRSLALSPPLSKTFVDLGANGISSKTSGCFWKNIEVDQRLEVHKTITYLPQIRTSLKNSLVWTASHSSASRSPSVVGIPNSQQEMQKSLACLLWNSNTSWIDDGRQGDGAKETKKWTRLVILLMLSITCLLQEKGRGVGSRFGLLRSKHEGT